MRRSAFFVGTVFASVVVVASCGARTGLDVPIPVDAAAETGHHHEAGHDVTVDAPRDALPDVPEAGRPLDAKPECDAPTYCEQNDPNYIYKCGVRVYQCGALEQCEVRCGDGGTSPSDAGTDAGSCSAACVNPCLDTLGQNTSNGCEFYAAEMDMIPQAVGVCYAVFVVNQWNTGEPAKLAVDLGGQPLPVEQFARIPNGTGQSISYGPFDPAIGIPQNEVALLFLSRAPAADAGAFNDPTSPSILASCPPGITPALITDGAIHGTGIGAAFHIRSNVPVVAYQMLPYGAGRARITGATLLLPTNVWGTNYLAVNAYEKPSALIGDAGPDAEAVTGQDLERAGPSMVILAGTNDTHVTINPVVDIVAGPGVPPSPAGQPITYTLDQGQYIQFTQQAELSGSAIQSDQPVALIAGSTIMDVPVTQPKRADHGEQMIPPVQALGNLYVGVRYRTRNPSGAEESVPWRMIGAVDGTTLTFDPPQPGAPATINAHQVTEFQATGPFVVSSQDASHPFYFAQYMTGGAPFGGSVEAGLGGIGDPDYVNVVSPSQYLPRYTFFTDPTYPETNLVVVRMLDKASGQFPNVTLDCSGVLTGWQAVGSSGQYQFTRVDLSTGNFQAVNGCNNGVHTIVGSFSADGGDAGGSTPYFGVTIWGWGSPATDPLPDLPESDGGSLDEADPRFTRWVSYAYPAGANITKLNSVVVPAN